ncbi:unnamed protein product [Blepharisma stoltei]|uniref:Uncharacterized protein n=1 Tax=Blepharisma stoltei TaxID=1481888 RepID=A0AAU9JJU0_9CILI|nr:unnamed protein product [Blepharisma stoltei]
MEIRKNLKELENIKTESEWGLLIQMSIITNDIDNKLEEIESNLYIINILINEITEILRWPNNPKLEMDFGTTYSAYQNNSSANNRLLIQAYQDYHNAYQKKTSLYNIIREHKRPILNIYNTETETKKVKILHTSQPLDQWTCIAQLPNGKLFCFGNGRASGVTVLINMYGGVEALPSVINKLQLLFYYFLYLFQQQRLLLWRGFW